MQILILFLVVVLLAASAFFAGGYAWESKQSRLQRDAFFASGRDPAARKAALEALDEAVRAKYEKRDDDALAALERARHADPLAPGLDSTYAELVLNKGQFIEMRAAAAAAKKKGDHASTAAVLLGMDKWISRGSSDREMTAAVDAASGHFAEATEDDAFAAPPWFFWGDVLRYAGREAEGRDRTLAALHRFNPWDSSDVIAAKATIASAEAGGDVVVEFNFVRSSPWANALVNATRARTAGTVVPPGSLIPFASQLTLQTVAADRFFGVPHPLASPWPLLP